MGGKYSSARWDLASDLSNVLPGGRFCVETQRNLPRACAMTERKSSPAGQLVGLMLLSVFALALTGLFGIWYLH